MTLGAFQSGVEVHFVREPDEIGETLRANPWNRLLVVPVGQELFRLRGLLPQRSMAGHADVNGGNRGGSRNGGPAMAKEAINLQRSRVALMAEGDRLARIRGEIGARLGVKNTENDRNTDDEKRDE